MRETVPLSTEDVTQLHEEASREKQQAEKDREVLREVREARLKRELEESGVEVESAGSDDGAGIMVAMKAGTPPPCSIRETFPWRLNRIFQWVYDSRRLR